MSGISTGYNERLIQFAEVRIILSIHGLISSLDSLTTTIICVFWSFSYMLHSILLQKKENQKFSFELYTEV